MFKVKATFEAMDYDYESLWDQMIQLGAVDVEIDEVPDEPAQKTEPKRTKKSDL